mmetsp:Transcript_28586/g.59768  ORF Transcript_28586/g.59768 Transcript_28586/m.59768 type:complete len:141 (+) Transcript_28586:1115-1537(+)
MMLVNAYLAFKFLTPNRPTLREFTNVVAQAMCADEEEEADAAVSASTRGAKQAPKAGCAVGAPSERITHAVVCGKTLGLGAKHGKGMCRLCSENHATGVCTTCSTGLGTADPKPFWLCYVGKHGRQCYCQHLHEMLQTRK